MYESATYQVKVKVASYIRLRNKRSPMTSFTIGEVALDEELMLKRKVAEIFECRLNKTCTRYHFFRMNNDVNTFSEQKESIIVFLK